MGTIGETSAQLALRDPDIRLMLQVRDDEPGAFEQLVERFQARLLTIMNHLVGNSTEAEDLSQEVFLRVYRARKKYHPKSKFSTWLFTIANNLALNALRSRKRKPEVSMNSSDSGPLGPRPMEALAPDPHSGPMKRIQQEELAGVVQQALQALNDRQKTAVVLNKFEDLNYAEIADVMGLTTKAVKSLLSRARANLRVLLTQYIYMDGEPVPVEPNEED